MVNDSDISGPSLEQPILLAFPVLLLLVGTLVDCFLPLARRSRPDAALRVMQVER